MDDQACMVEVPSSAGATYNLSVTVPETWESALLRSQIVADRSLIKEASRGRYQMVFVSPEFVDHSNANFKVLLGSN